MQQQVHCFQAAVVNCYVDIYRKRFSVFKKQMRRQTETGGYRDEVSVNFSPPKNRETCVVLAFRPRPPIAHKREIVCVCVYVCVCVCVCACVWVEADVHLDPLVVFWKKEREHN